VNRTREPSTEDEFVENVDKFVKDQPVLERFFKDKKDFIQDLARKAADLKNDSDTDLGNPDVLPKLIKVSLHQQVIYCGKLSPVQAHNSAVCSSLMTA
jgi:hypothetical protein